MIIQEISPLEMSSLHLVYDNMSPLDEKEGHRGIFHFLEHMMGQAIKPIEHELYLNGIHDDFSTSHEYVKASFSGTAEAMEKMAVAIVRQIVFFDVNQFTEDEFESERTAVINENRDRKSDTFGATIYRALKETYGIDDADGKMEDVTAYTFDEFKKDFVRYAAHPSRIIYVGPRNVDFPDIVFSEKPIFDSIMETIHSEPDEKDIVVKKSADARTVVLIGTEPIIGNRDFAAMTMATQMLGGDSESVLYNELRVKKGLVYSCDYTTESFRTVGITLFYTSTASENVDKVIGIARNILENPVKLLTREHFDCCKRHFGFMLKERNTMRFAGCLDLIRKGLITDSKDLLDIEYPEFLEIVPKCLSKGKIRAFAG